MGVEPRVSVIIPAYNAQATIADAIEGVLAQDYPGDVDLIVIDDGSVDRTGEIATSFAAVRYRRQENAGPAAARNHGAREAKGVFLFFTDADCRPERSWISQMMQGFAPSGVSVVAGSYGIANPGSLLARIIHNEIMFRHKFLMPEYPCAFGSYNVAIQRQVFERAGGFNQRYRRASGEDNDLSYKIIARGGLIHFLKDAHVAHHHQESLSKYLKEQYSHGFWRVRMYADFPQMMAGDGYTFWKDALEVPLAGAHFLCFLFPSLAFFLVVGFFLFQVIFGLVIMRGGVDGFAAGVVLWLRSFARVSGFITGVIFFLRSMLSNGKKI